MSDHSFRKARRVIRPADYSRILKDGSCVADGTLVLFALPNDRTDSRLGITVPKRTGNAVQRNRWKRLIRESFRTQPESIPKGFDLVIRPKKGASPDWVSIQQSVPYLCRKLLKKVRLS